VRGHAHPDSQSPATVQPSPSVLASEVAPSRGHQSTALLNLPTHALTLQDSLTYTRVSKGSPVWLL